MKRNWTDELFIYENILRNINFKEDAKFREIKWVWQDLPQKKVPNLYKEDEIIKLRHLQLASIYFYYLDNSKFLNLYL